MEQGRCIQSRSLQLDILARGRCHHGDCSAFRSLELWKCHWPLQAALSGSIIKAPGFAGGYLLLVMAVGLSHDNPFGSWSADPSACCCLTSRQMKTPGGASHPARGM
jgi:hypothetical protein